MEIISNILIQYSIIIWDQKDEDRLAKNIFVKSKNPEQVAKDYVDNHDHNVDDWLKDIDTK